MVYRIGRSIGVLMLTVSVLSAANASEHPRFELTDVDGRPVAPFGGAGISGPVVLVFISSDCPISNRSVPELRRLFERFRSTTVRFWLVYPNPADAPGLVSRHLDAFSLPIPALRDPAHIAARFAGVTVTPEAALFDAQRRLVYRGRIDDRFPRIGVERPAARQHDLEDAIVAALRNDSPALRTTDAVGCYLTDMAP